MSRIKDAILSFLFQRTKFLNSGWPTDELASELTFFTDVKFPKKWQYYHNDGLWKDYQSADKTRT